MTEAIRRVRLASSPLFMSILGRSVISLEFAQISSMPASFAS